MRISKLTLNFSSENKFCLSGEQNYQGKCFKTNFFKIFLPLKYEMYFGKELCELPMSWGQRDKQGAQQSLFRESFKATCSLPGAASWTSPSVCCSHLRGLNCVSGSESQQNHVDMLQASWRQQSTTLELGQTAGSVWRGFLPHTLRQTSEISSLTGFEAPEPGKEQGEESRRSSGWGETPELGCK